MNDAIVSSVSTSSDVLSDPLGQLLSENTQQKFSKLSVLQKSCAEFKDMFLYLSQNVLPEDEKERRRIVSESRHFDVIDDVLHYENPHIPGKWCVAVLIELRLPLLEDAHGGLLAGHLAEKRVYNRLRRSYLWPCMRCDVRKHCHSCPSCATRKGPTEYRICLFVLFQSVDLFTVLGWMSFSYP